MKRVFLSLAVAALSAWLGGSALADHDCDRPLDPCCKKCCKPKCCKPTCEEKICKPVPVKYLVECVSYDCRCEDYCLTKCPPCKVCLPKCHLPKCNLNLHGLLGNKCCNKGCGHGCGKTSCCPKHECCAKPCETVACAPCQECDKPRKRNVLIKKIALVEVETYKCVPEICATDAPALPPGEKLDSPEKGDTGDK